MRRLLAVLTVLPFLVVPTPAGAAPAVEQGWWTTLHQGAVPVTPPAPPDVSAGDLLLQGGDPGRVVPGAVLDSTPQPTAYGALRWRLDPDAGIGPLTLKVATGGQAMDVRAYAVLGGWTPAENGAIDDAPRIDDSRYAVAELSADGATLTVPEVGKLATEGGLLSIALVPGPVDRLVVRSPALQVTAPVVSPPPVLPTQAPVVVIASPPAPAPPVATPVVVPVRPVIPVAPRPVRVPAPVTAPAPQAVAASLPVASVRRIVADDARTRLLVGLEALLVLGFFWLLLRALREPAAADGRGIGRFRAERVGRAPRL
jgi:hypothetical protein